MIYFYRLCRWFNIWFRYRGYRRCPDCLKPRYVLGFRVGNHEQCIPF